MKILIIQTAFYGDVILALPMVQAIKQSNPTFKVDFLCIPKTSELLRNNNNINELIIYDKRGVDEGYSGFNKLKNKILSNKYDTIISVQRFLRTTLLTYFGGAKLTVGFDTASLSGFFKKKVKYLPKHEILRNLDLLKPIGIDINEIIRPEIYPDESDVIEIDKIFSGLNISNGQKVICAAPGSVWFTKRFPADKYISLFNKLDESDYIILLIGDSNDAKECEKILSKSTNNNIYNYAGKLTILQSAELIKRSSLLLTNDSAPLHIANSVSTDVIAFFGSTVREFGFYPYGKRDIVFEIDGLKCRPCNNHGMDYCKIKSFDCMNKISEQNIIEKITELLRS
jgi:heptosyltransferase II